MKNQSPAVRHPVRLVVRNALTCGLHLLCLALIPGLAQHAAAQTTISGTVTLADPATGFGAAGIVTMQHGATLQMIPSAGCRTHVRGGQARFGLSQLGAARDKSQFGCLHVE